MFLVSFSPGKPKHLHSWYTSVTTAIFTHVSHPVGHGLFIIVLLGEQNILWSCFSFSFSPMTNDLRLSFILWRVFFFCLNSSCPPSILLALSYTVSKVEQSAKEARRFALIITFTKSNKNSPVLQQCWKILPFWSNAVSILAEHVISSLEFLPGNYWNLMAWTHHTPNTNFFVIKRAFMKKS